MGLDKDEIDRRVRRAAGFAGIREETLSRSPFDLSGGQKRRAAIAGVIAMEPDVLVLDEPTAGLDPLGQQTILENIRAYQRSQNAAVIMVSHSMEDVAACADRLLVMHDGVSVMSGTPHEIFSRPDELRAVGLDVPQITKVFLRLREMGLDADPAVYTVQQAKAAILAMKGGKLP
jgi:energy-coupling factor transport system ATP-binding protein